MQEISRAIAVGDFATSTYVTTSRSIFVASFRLNNSQLMFYRLGLQRCSLSGNVRTVLQSIVSETRFDKRPFLLWIEPISRGSLVTAFERHLAKGQKQIHVAGKEADFR